MAKIQALENGRPVPAPVPIPAADDGSYSQELEARVGKAEVEIAALKEAQAKAGDENAEKLRSLEARLAMVEVGGAMQCELDPGFESTLA